ncbi:PAC2 family protein [Leucobacter viscericola]|uniref:PAC2 family protein n=1 Tax=Leucobacter viscericola TaxID=2714935 RepID=A0A6G7XBL6_9MICO|nr:PAC2 family protein [Leucobacter viscericola]QIK61839.1 PAC2 family protein [Leucobacter viscericola]
MTESDSQHPRVLIMAFQGWSDAGDATTEVLQHLGGLIDAEVLHVIAAEGYVDFQVHRPKLVFDEAGNRVLDWPDTRLLGTVQRPSAVPEATSELAAELSTELASELAAELAAEPRTEDPQAETLRRLDGTPVTDLFLLAGVEPARDWQNFADEVLELVDVWAIDTVIILGSMFSDAPHSRPIVTTVSTESAKRRAETGAVRSSYEGPAGIATVIDLALAEAGIAPISLWAQVPHYVHSTPSPKATLALLDKLEEVLDIVIPRGELLAQANEWESNINRIAAADDEMSRYIRRLEESRDEALAAESTGDAIALEFEKFLEDDRESKPKFEDPDEDPGFEGPRA